MTSNDGTLAGSAKRVRSTMKRKRPLLLLIPAALCFVPLLGPPYGYYTFLRFAVCITAFLLMVLDGIDWMLTHKSLPLWAIFGCAIAILFNPILKVALPRETWLIIDIVVGIVFVIAAFKRSPIYENAPLP